jgi:hypothetical protein
MLLAAKWTDLVVLKVYFVNEAVEFRERKDFKSIKLAT